MRNKGKWAYVFCLFSVFLLNFGVTPVSAESEASNFSIDGYNHLIEDVFPDNIFHDELDMTIRWSTPEWKYRLSFYGELTSNPDSTDGTKIGFTHADCYDYTFQADHDLTTIILGEYYLPTQSQLFLTDRDIHGVSFKQGFSSSAWAVTIFEGGAQDDTPMPLSNEPPSLSEITGVSGRWNFGQESYVNLGTLSYQERSKSYTMVDLFGNLRLSNSTLFQWEVLNGQDKTAETSANAYFLSVNFPLRNGNWGLEASHFDPDYSLPGTPKLYPTRMTGNAHGINRVGISFRNSLTKNQTLDFKLYCGQDNLDNYLPETGRFWELTGEYDNWITPKLEWYSYWDSRKIIYSNLTLPTYYFFSLDTSLKYHINDKWAAEVDPFGYTEKHWDNDPDPIYTERCLKLALYWDVQHNSTLVFVYRTKGWDKTFLGGSSGSDVEGPVYQMEWRQWF